MKSSMTSANPTPKDVVYYLHNHKTSKDVIVIGQSPAKTNTPSASGTYAKVQAWMTVAGVYAWSFTNVIEEEGGSKLSQVDYDAVFNRVRPWIGKKIIALGNVASDVLTELRIPHLKVLHPSGKNYALNNHDNEIAQIKKIRMYVKGKK